MKTLIHTQARIEAFRRDGLVQLCLDIPEDRRNVCVEIGSYMGESTAIFAQHFSVVHAIDPWTFTEFAELCEGSISTCGKNMGGISVTGTEIEEKFDENMQAFDNVFKVKARGEDTCEMFEDGSIDLLFIDSIHTCAALSGLLELWRPKLRDGGVLAGGAYVPYFPEVVDVVNRMGTPTVYEDWSWSFINKSNL